MPEVVISASQLPPIASGGFNSQGLPLLAANDNSQFAGLIYKTPVAPPSWYNAVKRFNSSLQGGTLPDGRTIYAGEIFPNDNGSGYVSVSSDAQMLSKQFQQGADQLTTEVNNLQSQPLVAPLGPPPTTGPIFSMGGSAEIILDDKKFGINYSTDSGFEVDFGSDKITFSLDQEGSVGIKVLNVGTTTTGDLDPGPVTMKPNGSVNVAVPLAKEVVDGNGYSVGPSGGINVISAVQSIPSVPVMEQYETAINTTLNNISTTPPRIDQLNQQIQLLKQAAAYFGSQDNFPQQTYYKVLSPGAS